MLQEEHALQTDGRILRKRRRPDTAYYRTIPFSPLSHNICREKM